MQESPPPVTVDKLFLWNQGFQINEATLYQDNKSAMLLEGNGHALRLSSTKHINVLYFFMKNQIDKGSMIVEHFSANNMVNDYFTKPLQGRKFKYFRSRIMGFPPETEQKVAAPVKSSSKPTSPLKSILKSGLSSPPPRPCPRSTGVCWSSTNNRLSALREKWHTMNKNYKITH